MEELTSPSNWNVPVHRQRKPPRRIEIRKTLLGAAVVKVLWAVPAVKNVAQVLRPGEGRDSSQAQPHGLFIGYLHSFVVTVAVSRHDPRHTVKLRIGAQQLGLLDGRSGERPRGE